MDAFRDCVECRGMCEVKVRGKEDGGYGIEGCEEFSETKGWRGRVGLSGGMGSALEEAVPFWGDCTEVGVKVLALDTGEHCGGDGGEGGVGLGGGKTLVGVVEHIGDGWGR